MILTKDTFLPPSVTDGYRILVEKEWPAGLINDEADIRFWIQNIAPSEELTEWYNEHPDKWDEFRDKYDAELFNKRLQVEIIANRAQSEDVTLLFKPDNQKKHFVEALKDFVYSHFMI